MSRETKVGLTLVVVLVAAFGFVVFRKIQNRDDLFVEEQNSGGASSVDSEKRESHSQHKHGTVVPPYDGRKKPPAFPQNHERPTGLFAEQKEPDGHSHGPEGNPFDKEGSPFIRNPQSGRGESQFEADALAESSISGMTWIFSQPPPPPAPRPSENPWDLDGKKPVAQTIPPSAGENPFGQTGGILGGDTRGFENTPGLNDGFRNAETKRTGTVQIFPTGHRRTTGKEPAHAHSEPGGAVDLFPSGGNNTTNTNQPPQTGQHNHDQRSPFGQNSSTSEDFLPTPKQDGRLGAFQVGNGGQVRSGSSTHVHGRHAQDDLTHPFGKSPGVDAGQQPFGVSQPSPRSRSGYRPAPTPDPVDGHHHFPNGEPVAPTAHTADRPQVHTVQHGENYWSISQKAYSAGRYYQALAAYNSYRIPDPKKMRPGMKVLIPSLDILAKRHPKLCPGYASADHTHAGGDGKLPPGFFRNTDGQPMYRVGKTDTLSDIAQKHLGRASRWIQVYRINERLIKNPNRLTIGTELMLPADASRISLVPTPTRYR